MPEISRRLCYAAVPKKQIADGVYVGYVFFLPCTFSISLSRPVVKMSKQRTTERLVNT